MWTNHASKLDPASLSFSTYTGLTLPDAAALQPSLGLVLTGPYDVLAGRLKGVPWEKCVLHRRHFYDPPEMVTVLEASGDDTDGFHIGYFRYVHMDFDVHVQIYMYCNHSLCDVWGGGENGHE